MNRRKRGEFGYTEEKVMKMGDFLTHRRKTGEFGYTEGKVMNFWTQEEEDFDFTGFRFTI